MLIKSPCKDPSIRGLTLTTSLDPQGIGSLVLRTPKHRKWRPRCWCGLGPNLLRKDEKDKKDKKDKKDDKDKKDKKDKKDEARYSD